MPSINHMSVRYVAYLSFVVLFALPIFVWGQRFVH